MTADKANEFVDFLNSDATSEARLAAWLWIEGAIHEAVAEAEAVAHATGRLNMALAIENERERCAEVAEPTVSEHAHENGCVYCTRERIAAAIRKVKP